MQVLKQKIQSKKAVVAVIGLGYVGLPLARAIKQAGFEVIGIDIRKIKDKIIKTTNSYDELKKADIIIICLPTPLTKHKEPDMSYIKAGLREIKKRLRKNKLVILESTTYPGTTEEILLPALKSTGLKVGQDFFLAFVSERLDPGNKKFNIKNTPKVIGGVTRNCTNLTRLFYQQFVDEVFSVSSPKVAEMSKLLENIFRIVNISMINELMMLCDKMQIDIWEVIEAAKTKPFGFMPFYPSAGAGGHCIPIDPFYLSWKAKEYGFFTRFIELAGEINELMPHYVVTKIIWALNNQEKSIKNSKILIWGIAYKKDIADTRESPAIKIIWDLMRKGARIFYHDPYVPEIEINNKRFKSVKLTNQILKNVDCLLILTDHSGYDYEDLTKKAKLVVDTKNIVKTKLSNVYKL
ncbi:MAG: UDP-N-acetyl-D-glucosamine dehydrogenase [Candidatus Portnoybacteria bacterium CG23_combo_of_CG06-09_8_20_14_all_37_13]|uniref:UDP-N-acetyl-D-glucosamine dehydrogenase n=1 Tax=Candidatus Portnoybacteria bacterium CG23_combo_of_CG06-09_8_20_14_all_37_13 TaxID=1974819 RepID=A0A2G9YD64_9BACT|nr:MAG: UDP-N-acetyl-D-glucosamine dehydrogenase [Candidatus Portnoybacteria bacterium CG23_combo_of_CG06-09_8_20_14_all_37_13]